MSETKFFLSIEEEVSEPSLLGSSQTLVEGNDEACCETLDFALLALLLLLLSPCVPL